MTICGEWSLVKREEDTITAIPLRCHRWDCPDCAPHQKRRFLRALENTPVDALLTLTCRPSWFGSPYDAFRAMSRAIPHLMKRLKRALNASSIEYVVVWEETQRGWPHAHILLRGPYLPQRLVSRHWNALTGASVVDIRRVHQTGEARAYVSKYLAKQPRVPRGFRRFRSSRAFWAGQAPYTHPKREGSSPWKLRRDHLSYVAQNLVRLGFKVTFARSSAFTAQYVQPPPSYTFSRLAGNTLPLCASHAA